MSKEPLSVMTGSGFFMLFFPKPSRSASTVPNCTRSSFAYAGEKMKAMEPPTDEVMDYRGLSGYVKLAERTLRKIVMRGEIPFFKISLFSNPLGNTSICIIKTNQIAREEQGSSQSMTWLTSPFLLMDRICIKILFYVLA